MLLRVSSWLSSRQPEAGPSIRTTDRRDPTLSISAGTGLGQHVDELRNDGSRYAVRLPGGAHRYPRALLGSQIAENHILGGGFLQRLRHHRLAETRRYKRQRASRAVPL